MRALNRRLRRRALAVLMLAVAVGCMGYWASLVFAEVEGSGSRFTQQEDTKTSDGGNLTKKAEMSDDESTVTITIEAEIENATPKVLFMQGSLCTSHTLTADVPVSALNALLQFGDVDYLYAVGYQNNATSKWSSNGITTFTKGETVTTETAPLSGIKYSSSQHMIVGDPFTTEFAKALTGDDYDLVILLFDGFAGAFMSYFGYDYSEASADIYAIAQELASLQTKNALVYLLPVKTANDTVFYYDSLYPDAKEYFSNPDLSSKKSSHITNAYLDQQIARGILALEAYLDPINWLTLVDSTGAYTVGEMPDFDFFTVPSNMVSYGNADTVSNYIQNLLVPNVIELNDALAPGLSATEADIAVQEYDYTTGEWQTLTEGFTVTLSGTDIAVAFDYSEQEVVTRRVRVIITASADPDLGADGESFPTNNGDTCLEYQHDDTVITTECVESPELQKQRRARLIVHHYLNGTEEKLADDEERTVYYDDEYATSWSEAVLGKGYVLVATSGNENGIITQDLTEVIYYYELAPEESTTSDTPTAPDTGLLTGTSGDVAGEDSGKGFVLAMGVVATVASGALMVPEWSGRARRHRAFARGGSHVNKKIS